MHSALIKFDLSTLPSEPSRLRADPVLHLYLYQSTGNSYIISKRVWTRRPPGQYDGTNACKPWLAEHDRRHLSGFSLGWHIGFQHRHHNIHDTDQ